MVRVEKKKKKKKTKKKKTIRPHKKRLGNNSQKKSMRHPPEKNLATVEPLEKNPGGWIGRLAGKKTHKGARRKNDKEASTHPQR